MTHQSKSLKCSANDAQIKSFDEKANISHMLLTDTRSSDCDKCRARDDDYDGNDDDDDDSKYDPSCMACRMRRFQNAVRQVGALPFIRI